MAGVHLAAPLQTWARRLGACCGARAQRRPVWGACRDRRTCGRSPERPATPQWATPAHAQPETARAPHATRQREKESGWRRGGRQGARPAGHLTPTPGALALPLPATDPWADLIRWQQGHSSNCPLWTPAFLLEFSRPTCQSFSPEKQATDRGRHGNRWPSRTARDRSQPLGGTSRASSPPAVPSLSSPRFGS